MDYLLNRVIGVNVDDAPVHITKGALNCWFKCVGSTFGRFIFTDWPTLAECDPGAIVIGCVFEGNGRNGYGLSVCRVEEVG